MDPNATNIAAEASSPQNSNVTTTFEPNLPLGDINLVVLTDVHSWVAGHGDNEGQNNLDVHYGDVVSFYEQLQQQCELSEDCGDLWLVQNGDWVDGTGLSIRENSTPLINVLKQIPFDVLNTGNHDLYSGSVIQETLKQGGYLDHWGPRHLSSNVYMADSMEPMSNRYNVLKGTQSTVLTFGFIYDLKDPADIVQVQKVQEAVEEEWFREVLLDSTIGYDAILVMLHAGIDDPSVEIIRQAIRSIVVDQDMPVQFIAGHTHMRRHGVTDARSKIVESGRYLDTVGFVTFPNLETIRTHARTIQNANFTETNETMHPPKDFNNTNVEIDAATDLFKHIFLDANRKTLREALGMPWTSKAVYDGDDDVFQTPKGFQVAQFIQDTRDSLGLTKHVGCAPQDYILNVTMTHEDSLWKLFRDEVGPHVLSTVHLLEENRKRKTELHRALFLSQDSWRYGLYGGDRLTVDDVIAVSPFDEPIYRMAILPCERLLTLNENMNNNYLQELYWNQLPAWILSPENIGDSEQDYCELYVNHFGIDRVRDGLEQMTPTIVVDLEESNLTTTNIWLSFVEDQWQCGDSQQNDVVNNTDKTAADGGLTMKENLRFSTESLFMVIVALSIIIFGCVSIVRRKKRSNRNHAYDGVFADSAVAAAGDSHDLGFGAEGHEPPVRIV